MRHGFRCRLTSPPRRWQLSKREQRVADRLDGRGDWPPDYWIREPGGTVRRATFGEWAIWFERRTYLRIVRRTNLEGGELVSTIFLGLDHSYGNGRRAALLWETYSSKHGTTERYRSEADALDAHDMIVAIAQTLPREQAPQTI